MPQETVLNHTEISSPSVPPASGPPEVREESELDLVELVRVLLQNKLIILKFSLVPAVLTAIMLLIMKPYYAGISSFLPPNAMSTGSVGLTGAAWSFGHGRKRVRRDQRSNSDLCWGT